jgi:hypothetical protein
LISSPGVTGTAAFSDGSFGFQPNASDASRTPVESDSHLSVCDNDRHASLAGRMFQHVGHAGPVLQHVHEFHRMTFSGISFTSRLRIRSRAFSENPNGAGHISLLEWLCGFQ